MKIFFSVGEPSGDLHGANLIRELSGRHDDWQFVGYGGPRMAAAGCKLHHDLTQLAIMWFLRALLHIRKFLRLVKDAEQYFIDHRPDAVILIDYPGFNWHIARVAKKHNVPVFYYGTPQLWAWAGWRVKKMRRNVDHVLCKLPFEEAWYRERGCQATYVGHPYFDELNAQTPDQAFIDQQNAKPGQLVTILPGSRTQEVKANLTQQLRAAKIVRQQVPGVRLAIAAYKASQAETVRAQLTQAGIEAEVHVGRTPELIAAADCCLAVSGSVSLELLYHAKPTAIVYSISRFAYFVQTFFRRVRYITLVNLLTAKELFPETVGVYDPNNPEDDHVLMPEYLTYEDRSPELAKHAIEWLTCETARNERIAQLSALRDVVGHGGASKRAADYFIDAMNVDSSAKKVA